MSSESSFVFEISPEPRYVDVDVSEGNFVDVVFLVKNRSHRPLRVEAIPHAVSAPDDATGTPLPLEMWEGWLQVLDDEGNPLLGDITFGDTGVKHIRVRVSLPERVIDGAYQFRLTILGVDNPDEEYSESDLVTVNVKGPQINVRRFVVIALILLAVVILLAVGAAFLLRPRPRLTVQFIGTPPNVALGEVATFKVRVKNERQSDAQNVLLEYTMPDGVIGATAHVPNAAFRYCDEDDRTIFCDLGTLGAGREMQVVIEAVAGPFPEVPTAITHTNSVKVTSRLDDRVATVMADTPLQATQVLTPTAFSVAIDPSVGTAVLEEAVTYRLLAWHNITDTETLSLTFHLPPKMHYVTPIPRDCDQLEDYFTLVCTREGLRYDSRRPEVATFVVNAIPSDTKSSARSGDFDVKIMDAQFVTAGVPPTAAAEAPPPGEQTPAPATAVSVKTRVVNSALQFNGISDYAELGYNRAPENLTVEMWVHPFSTNDGQSFIGAHRAVDDDVENIFLIGYWEGGLHVNVNGDSHELLDTKRSDRFHLAVTVRKLDAESSEVRVYVDGQPVDDWSDDDPAVEDDCAGCKIFDGALDGGETLNWVLGQDWDPGSQGPVESDFFHGALSDVRIWEDVRGRDAIVAGMNVRPQVGAEGLVANWRLEPIDLQSQVLPDRVSATNNGERRGASWGEPVARFGTALELDGLTDGLVSQPVEGGPWQLPVFDGGVPVSATLSAWVFVDSIPSEEQLITGLFSNKIIALAIDNDGHMVAVAPDGDGGSWVSRKDEQPIQAGRWVHYTAVLAPTTPGDDQQPVQNIRLYRDGQLVKNLRAASNPLQQLDVFLEFCSAGIYLGGPAGDCRGAYRFNFSGRLDEVRLWSRALEEDEINSWRNLPGIMFNEVGYWSFDDSPGHSSTRPCEAPPDRPDEQFTCGFHFVPLPEGDFEGEEIWLPVTVAGPAWINADSRIEQQFIDRR